MVPVDKTYLLELQKEFDVTLNFDYKGPIQIILKGRGI